MSVTSTCRWREQDRRPINAVLEIWKPDVRYLIDTDIDIDIESQEATRTWKK